MAITHPPPTTFPGTAISAEEIRTMRVGNKWVVVDEGEIERLIDEGDLIEAAVRTGIPMVDRIKLHRAHAAFDFGWRYGVEFHTQDEDKSKIYSLVTDYRNINMDDLQEREEMLFYLLNQLLDKVLDDFYVIRKGDKK